MKKVINVILAICAVAMLWICYRSIAGQQEFEAEVLQREADVKARLIEIRSAEEAYKNQYGEYCGSFDSLIIFVKEGKLPIVQKQGVLSDEQMEKGLTEASAAKIVNSGNAAAIAANGLQNFRRDTVWVSLIDSLYSKDFDPEQLRYIPNSDNKQFDLVACPSTTKSGSIIYVMECSAPYDAFIKGPNKLWGRWLANKKKDCEDKGVDPVLKIGEASMNWNNNAGNWE